MRRLEIDDEKVKELYLSGKSANEIAAQYNVAKNTIRNHLRSQGVEIRTMQESRLLQGRRGLDIQKVLEFYEQGYSISRISKVLGYGVSTIRKVLGETGVRIRGRNESMYLQIKLGFAKPLNRNGPLNTNWKGGKYKNPNGYVLMRKPDYYRSYRGYVLEHIYVWEQAHGPLPEGWQVHHINGIRDDNRLENLAGMSSRTHRNLSKIEQQRIRELELEVEALKILLEDSIKCRY